MSSIGCVSMVLVACIFVCTFHQLENNHQRKRGILALVVSF